MTDAKRARNLARHKGNRRKSFEPSLARWRCSTSEDGTYNIALSKTHAVLSRTWPIKNGFIDLWRCAVIARRVPAIERRGAFAEEVNRVD